MFLRSMSVWNETFQSLNLSGSTRAAVLSSLTSRVIARSGGLCWDRLHSPLISSFTFKGTCWWSSWSSSSSEHSFCSYTFCHALAASCFPTVSNRSTSLRLASSTLCLSAFSASSCSSSFIWRSFSNSTCNEMLVVSDAADLNTDSLSSLFSSCFSIPGSAPFSVFK